MFANAFGETPTTRALADVLGEIRGGRYAAQTARLRELRTHDPDGYRREKKKLPAFSVSGTAKTRKEPLDHSGLLQIDLDDLGGRLPTVRDMLRKDVHVAFGFVSPSGVGLKLGLRIDGERHARSFAAAEAYFKKRYDLTIDGACKDQLRLCFVSDDLGLWTNADAVVLRAEIEVAPNARTRKPVEAPTSLSSLSSLSSLGPLSPPGSSVLHQRGITELSGEEELAVKNALPTGRRQNHKMLFTLARAIKAIEKKEGSPMPARRAKALFDKWHELARPFLQADQNKDGYYFEFLSSLDGVRYPMGESVLSDAWKTAQEAMAPPEADQVDSAEVKLLVSFCYQLQRLGGQPHFYLSCRTVQNLFKLANHVTAWRWLDGLCRMGI